MFPFPARTKKIDTKTFVIAVEIMWSFFSIKYDVVN